MHTFVYREEKYFGCRENHGLKKLEKVKAAKPQRKSWYEGVACERSPATPASRTQTEFPETVQYFHCLYGLNLSASCIVLITAGSESYT